jgi:hypothetical protein
LSGVAVLLRKASNRKLRLIVLVGNSRRLAEHRPYIIWNLYVSAWREEEIRVLGQSPPHVRAAVLMAANGRLRAN